MKVNRNIKNKIFKGEGWGGDILRVSYDNRGEPFREGVTLDLEDDNYNSVSVFLEGRELIELKEFLNNLCGE